jgi:hypothetical protein
MPVGGNHFAGNQAVIAEAVDSLVMFALEKQVRVLDEFSVDLVLPAQGKCHVFWRQVEGSILVPGPDDNQGRHHEAAVPDRSAGIELDNFDRRLAHNHSPAFGLA